MSAAPAIHLASKTAAAAPPLADYLKQLSRRFDDASKPGRWSRFYTWTRVELYWRGQQLIWFNQATSRWEQMDEELVDLYFINNIINPFVEQIAAEYTKSNPKLIAYSTEGDDHHILGTLDHAQYLIDCWGQTLWKPEDLQREAHIVQFRTGVFTRTYFDPDGGPEVEGVGKLGCVRSDAIDPLEVEIWDRARDVAGSPFLLWERAEFIERVYKMFPHLESLPKDDKSKDNLMLTGLGFKRQLEIACGNTGEADANAAWFYGGQSNFSHESIIDDVTARVSSEYFDADVYHRYVTMQDERLPGRDEVIPKGTKLLEVFDAGLLVHKVNGQPVFYENVDKDDEWDCYKYQVPAAGFWGVGSENLMAQQEWFNEFGSILTASGVYASNGITVANTAKIKNGTVINKPGTIVAVEDMLPGEKLEDVLTHLTTSGFDASMLQMPQFLKESMQFTSGARNSQVSGLPDQGINTATGVMNAKATADSFTGSRLELRAANQARRMEQALKVFQSRMVYPSYYSRFGETKGRWLQALDVGGQIRVRVEEDSHMPRTNLDLRMDTAQALQMGYGTGTLRPDVERHLGKVFQLPTELDKSDEWAVLGQSRLDAMEEAVGLASQAAQMNGIDEASAQPYLVQECLLAAQPDELDDHASLIEFYMDRYLSDWYRNASDTLKAALHELIRLHKMGAVQSAQEQTGMAVVAQQPAMEAEREQQQAGQEQQAESEQIEREHENEQSEAERGQEAAMMEAQMMESDAAREQEMMMAENQSGEAEAQRQHEREMQESQQEHERQMARVKTKK